MMSSISLHVSVTFKNVFKTYLMSLFSSILKTFKNETFPNKFIYTQNSSRESLKHNIFVYRKPTPTKDAIRRCSNVHSAGPYPRTPQPKPNKTTEKVLRQTDCSI